MNSLIETENTVENSLNMTERHPDSFGTEGVVSELETSLRGTKQKNSEGIEVKNPLYPIFVKLEKFDVLVVGGGNVGLEKLESLLRNSPKTRITVVAPFIRPETRAYAALFPQVILQEKRFEPSDLEGKTFVIATTDDKAVNIEVKRLAEERRILANVADTPDYCDFYLGSIVQKGSLKIAISTNGKSPTVAKRLKENLNEILPDSMEEILNNMGKIREVLRGDFAKKIEVLNKVTSSLAADSEAVKAIETGKTDPLISLETPRNWQRIATMSLVAFGALLAANVFFYSGLNHRVDPQFWGFLAVGFGAQLVDGLLGMGYGVISQIFLMSLGIPPAAIGSSIHTAEMFSSGASGFSHYKFGNVNKKLFKVLVIPGVLGAIGGALALSYFGEKYGSWIKPIIAVYAMILGIRILSRAFAKQKGKQKVKNAGWLALAGGFLDSFGGGGWGPLVTSTLISKGRSPQYVIGSISVTEFFVTLASALTFFSVIGISHWQVILGLTVGGVIAAPFSAKLAGKLPTKWMFIAVGTMVIFWSLRILVKFI
jgi:uncharacterized protein